MISCKGGEGSVMLDAFIDRVMKLAGEHSLEL
jgi:hypothetical protein